MRIGLRKTTIATGIVAGLLTAATTMTTAAAAASPTENEATGTVKARGHGDMTTNVTGRPTAGRPQLAPPTTSPPAESRRFFPGGGSFTCESGRVCTGVPYSNGFYLFKFFKYGRYGLSQWHGTGFVVNHQTGGAAFRIYDNNGRQRGCFPPRSAPYNGVNWEPIWSVRLTASRC